MGGANAVLDMADRFAEQGNPSDAEALIRLALRTDPESARGHIALAQLRAGRGERDDAVAELVATARRIAATEDDDPAPLYALFAAALELDPERLSLHIDLAEIQAKHGDVPGAQARLVQLSAIYVDAGQPEDARAVLGVASAWDPQSAVAGVIETALPLEESVPILLEEVEEEDVPQPAPPPRQPKARTVCTPTLLRDATGDVLPNQASIPAPKFRRRRPRAATICTPTLLRDATGDVLPNQDAVPAPKFRRRRAATICTPTLLRDAAGSVLPDQASIPKPAFTRRRRTADARLTARLRKLAE